MATPSNAQPAGVRSNVNDLNTRLHALRSHLSDLYMKLVTPPPPPAAGNTAAVPQVSEALPVTDAVSRAHALLDDIHKQVTELHQII